MRKKLSTLNDYADANQVVVLEYLNALPAVSQGAFIEYLESIDIKSLYQVYLNYKKGQDAFPETISPMQKVLTLDSIELIRNELLDPGYQAISQGKVCIAMMAGGQGTRLGFNKPKGMYDIGLPSHKSLFQIYCESILELQEKIKNLKGDCKPILFLIMSSEDTDEDTKHFFIENNYFGLKQEQIVFFIQDSLPILSTDGQFIFSGPDQVLKGPDGNGGVFKSLYNQGLIDQMMKSNIQYIHICPVDNVLCNLADPVWVGYIVKEQLTIGSKFVQKAYPAERVGVHVIANGRPGQKEYSELSIDDAQKVDENGRLVYYAAGISQMICRVDFINQISTNQELNSKYHVASKKYPYYDLKLQQYIKPEADNAVKFELFYFDCYSLCPFEKFGIIEARREQEFAPVKNAPGSAVDSPDTARVLYLNAKK